MGAYNPGQWVMPEAIPVRYGSYRFNFGNFAIFGLLAVAMYLIARRFDGVKPIVPAAMIEV